MYLESEETSCPMPPVLSTSSPHSGDSWMNYSSHSSNEEYSSPSRLCNSEDDDSVVKKNKRIRDGRFPFSQNNDVDMTATTIISPPLQAISKRTRSKETILNGKSDNKRRQKVPIPKVKSSSENQVEVRMIDFAHTTFSRKGSSGQPVSGTIHHGPDNGFLTGIDSLQRLLTEILSEK